MLNLSFQKRYQQLIPIHLLVFINNRFFNLNIFSLNNYSTVYIGSFHLQPQISKICTGLHTIYTYAQEGCTQGFWVPVGIKLTHLATASRVLRKVYWQICTWPNTDNTKRDEMYRVHSYDRQSVWKWYNVGMCSIICKSTRNSEGVKDKKKKM